MLKGKLAKRIARARKTPAYWAEHAILDFTSALWSAMKRKNISQADLARTTQTSPAYISRVLSGNANFTVKSMVSFAHALDMHVRIDLRESAERVAMDSGSFRTFMSELGALTGRRQTVVFSKQVDMAANDAMMQKVVNG